MMTAAVHAYLFSVSAFMTAPPLPHGVWAIRSAPAAVATATGDDALRSAPTAEQGRALATVQPSPALQPREVIDYMLSALHKSNLDSPSARFGCEVALRFLAPSNPASKASPQRFADYLGQTWYQPLLRWNEYRWEGDLTLLGEREAFQQVSVRSTPDEPWVSVRWILVRVPFYGTTDQWMVEAVFVEEPDGAATEMPLMPRATDPDGAPGSISAEELRILRDARTEGPGDVVLKVMRTHSPRLLCTSPVL